MDFSTRKISQLSLAADLDDTDEIMIQRGSGPALRAPISTVLASAVAAGAAAGAAAGGELDLATADVSRDADGAVSRPFINRLQETRLLTDFIDRSQWAAIRNNTATDPVTNSYGQNAWDHAVADVADGGGNIVVPEGDFPTLGVILVNRPYVKIDGCGSGSRIRNLVAASDTFQMTAAFCQVTRLRSEPIATKTGGAFVRSTNDAPRLIVEDLECHREWSTWTHWGAITPTAGVYLDSGIFEGRYLRAYETPVGGDAFWFRGGYAALLEDVISAGDNAFKCNSNLRVDRCADLRVQRFQFLNAVRPVICRPGAGTTAASLKLQDGYCGLSQLGSLLSVQDGGNIVSPDIRDVWMGETEGANAHGLTLIGQGGGAGSFVGGKLTSCEFPLATGDGLHVEDNPQVQVLGGWADGCGGAGYSFTNSSGWSLIGARSGADRFGGNLYGGFVGPTCDHFRIAVNDFRGNTNNLANGAGTGASKQLVGNLV